MKAQNNPPAITKEVAFLLSLLLGVPAKQASDWKESRRAFSKENAAAYLTLDRNNVFTPKRYEAFKDKFSDPSFSPESSVLVNKALVAYHQIALETFEYWSQTYEQQLTHYNLSRMVEK